MAILLYKYNDEFYKNWTLLNVGIFSYTGAVWFGKYKLAKLRFGKTFLLVRGQVVFVPHYWDEHYNYEYPFRYAVLIKFQRFFEIAGHLL